MLWYNIKNTSLYTVCSDHQTTVQPKLLAETHEVYLTSIILYTFIRLFASFYNLKKAFVIVVVKHMFKARKQFYSH